MTNKTASLFGLVYICSSLLNAQTPLVGSGSSYSNIFFPSASVTYNVPGGGLLSVTISDGLATGASGVWDLSAQGGMNANLLGLGLTESAARTSLTGSALQFNISNDPNSLLGALGVGTSVHYGWQAQAVFDTSGVLNYQPNTMYNISFNVDGNNGLLNSVAGVTPQFSFELIDGSGNALSSVSSGSLINIAGLLGAGIGSGTVNLTYMTDGAAPTGPIGVRFTGDATLGASALNIGTTFATVSDLSITAAPVPEPGSFVLLGAGGVAFLLRRKRTLRPNLKA